MMLRRNLLLGLAGLALAACARGNGRLGMDGIPAARIFRITPEDVNAIPFRMQDSINTLRRVAGAQPVQVDAQLTAAAATHSRDMAAQNRPWHFGSDGSSPLDRLSRVGYRGRLIGEAISESFESDAATLAAWMQNSDTKGVIMDPAASRMGISWFQEPGGKIWWTLVMGA